MSKSHDMANKLILLSERELRRRRKEQGMKPSPTYGQVITFADRFVETLTDGQWAELGEEAGHVREDGRRQRIREDTKQRVKAIVNSLAPTGGAPFEGIPQT